MVNDGAFGVTFFFILSGFILYYNYARSFHSLRRQELLPFYVNRVARIYPVHVLSFLLVMPFFLKPLLQEPAVTSLKMLVNALLLQAWVPDVRFYFSINNPSWSISNEFFFYALFPLVVWFLRRRNGLRVKQAAGCMIGIWLITISVAQAIGQSLYEQWALFIFPLMRLMDFLAGIALASIYPALEPAAEKAGPGPLRLLEFLSAAAVLASVCFSSHMPSPLLKAAYWYPAAILAICTFAFGKGFLSRVLSSRRLVFLGEASFSFYMLHLPVQRFLGYVLPVERLHPAALSLINLAAALTVSGIVFVWFEKPMRAWIRQLAEKKPGLPALVRKRDYVG